VPPTATPPPTATGVNRSEGVDPGAGGQGDDQEEPDLQFEWGELFDALALGASYLWLGCGVFMLLAIPVVFVVLWVASNRRKRQQQEE
jgi:hypothetical protein